MVHRLLIGESAGAVGNGLCVCVDEGEGLDEVLLALRAGFELEGPCDLSLGGWDSGGGDCLPERMVVAHGDAPVCHGAGGIEAGDVLEGSSGFGVGEGVKQSDGAIERLLYGGGAGDGEGDGAEFLGGGVVVLLRVDGKEEAEE